MDFDPDLVRALQEDGRATIQDLARRLRQPRAAVSARLRTMLDDGTLRVVAAVDPVVLGQRVLAHVSVRVDGPADEVARQLRDRPEPVLVSAVGGVFDLVTEVRLASMTALHRFLTHVHDLPHVVEINTLVYSRVIRGFFVPEYLGGVTIDATDIALIEQLQGDGRRSFRSLGDVVRLSPSAVATRVQRLIDTGVIKISAVEMRGLGRRQLSMGIGVNLAGASTDLIREMQQWSGVEFAALTIGRFDAVLTIGGPTSGALYEMLERVRAVPGVVRTESWQHLAVLKEDYTRTIRPLGTT
jgi:DNA-binding Lrp family transcriptional regulator